MVFSAALLDFLADLAAHNDRDWFRSQKARYERDVKAPLHAFAAALGPRLAAVDPDARVDARSVFRIHRDTRFSADKSPYKTNAGLHFASGEHGVHRPGYYLHLQPGASFFGAGLWHPEAPALAKIRATLDTHRARWIEVRDAVPPLGGDALVRVPRGYAADHPLAEDLRRKDFVVTLTYADAEIVGAGFLDRFVADCARARPLVAFLAEATA